MPQQVSRLLIVFALAGGALVAARYFLVPETFGDVGHYRAAAVDSIVTRARKYAGHQECALCHSQVATQRLEGKHKGVNCEVCHGPAMPHVSNPLDVKPDAPRGRDFCVLCHAYNPSRPTGFAQIDTITHNPLSPCMGCHDPHAPEPPVVPQECSACHGQISRQKAVSHHATVACIACHEAPQQHKLEPLSARPTKPASRSFCGGCHAEDAPAPARIPRIDIRTHGEEFLCWQCHYPHYPEAGG